jgi:hypothetical protein
VPVDEPGLNVVEIPLAAEVAAVGDCIEVSHFQRRLGLLGHGKYRRELIEQLIYFRKRLEQWGRSTAAWFFVGRGRRRYIWSGRGAGEHPCPS